jgi:hypothetical protein
MAIPFSLLLGRGRCIFVSYETMVIHKIEGKKEKRKKPCKPELTVRQACFRIALFYY